MTKLTAVRWPVKKQRMNARRAATRPKIIIAPLTALRWDHTALDFRERELGVLAGNHNVAIEDHLDAAAICTTVHSGNDRLGRGMAPREPAETVY